jgi:hypothetical protein
MQIHYAIQTCDSSSNQTESRYPGVEKKQITQKCITSFFYSLTYAAEKNKDVMHFVKIFDDRSSLETINYINLLIKKNSCDNIFIEIEKLNKPGIMNSISECFNFLKNNGKDLVYLVQDDYLFFDTCIFEMIDVFFQIYKECGIESIISPYNDSWLWLVPYRNKCTPRTIIVGSKRYWIQYYDMSCSYMTSINVIKNNWDLIQKFLFINSKGDENNNLENISLNYMLTQRNILGLVPVSSLALHVQSELEKDPYIDWQKLWNSVILLE